MGGEIAFRELHVEKFFLVLAEANRDARLQMSSASCSPNSSKPSRVAITSPLPRFAPTRAMMLELNAASRRARQAPN